MNYQSLLIANRGEIAVRIMLTAQSMGIKCIAVYVNDDKDSLHVQLADEAVKIEDNGYLDANAIIEAAKKSNAEAIHPGYGFLSENAKFARKVLKEKIIWVGPSPKVISAMGDKLKAKELAEKAGVPTLPMSENVKNITKLGLPLLIKAAAGGGGKGMRIVKDKKMLNEALKGAKREALAGFGDDRVFIERYIEKSRHIEIQILGDSNGNIVHLGERECSIQRRHQKIIEESPSPRISNQIRNAMGNAAVKLAKSIKYESAGTVEFLFDDQTDEFWFLEVNTRLQVEHPVTEEVTGIDLVAEQLKIARGDELEFVQDDIEWHGSAIEARLYAENPENNFLPETGTMFVFEKGLNDYDTRWDSGISSGSKIGTNFDPMLAKVISHANSRVDAVNKLAKSLEDSHIGGVITNKDFLIATLRSKEFLDGNTTTDFIDKVKPETKKQLSEIDIERALAGATLWLQEINRNSSPVLGNISSNWTNGRLPLQYTKLLFRGDEYKVKYSYKNNIFNIFEKKAEIIECDEMGIDFIFNGLRSFSRVSQYKNNLVIHMPFGDISLKILPRFEMTSSIVEKGGMIAPMPGKVVDLKVKKGKKVKAGDILVILEAMKMEHTIRASEDGVIDKVMIAKGDQVENGAVLLILNSNK